mgnify:CR=1 FL=1
MSLMLYLHIPFCVRKCAYCDFVSYAGCEAAMPRYVDALIAEMDRRPSRERVSSVFFGGGTPSLLSAGELSRLLRAIRERYDLTEHCEISSEANPGTVTPQWLDAAAEGLNLLDAGHFPTENGVLPVLEGYLKAQFPALHAERTFEMARTAGIRNLSADLMYALPGQTVEMWEQSLREVMALNPWHLSCYALTVAEGTPFGNLDEQGKLPRPSEEEELAMQESTVQILKAHGLCRYEVSNYAKPGCACRHNVGYWTRRDYIGLGCAAHSLEGNLRRANVAGLEEYMKGAPFVSEERLTRQDAEFEELMLGLRMVEGVTLSPGAWKRFREGIERFCTQGLMCESERRVWLTPRGMDVMNAILEELMPE